VALLKKRNAVSFGGLSYVFSFGFTIAAAVVLAYVLGTWCDRKFGTEPWFLIGFLLWFIVAAFVKLFQVTKTCNQKQQ
jgi:ATP synthase protein I